MIQANIIAVDQSLELASGLTKNFLVLQLANGAFVRAEVDEQATRAVLQQVVGDDEELGEVTPAAAGAKTVDISPPPTPPAGINVTAAPEQLVSWDELPEDVLSEHMKRALEMLNAPAEMPFEQLSGLVKQIQDSFTPDDWIAVGVSPGAIEGPRPPQPAAPQPAPQPQQPAVGEIQWADGSPIVPGMGRVARTVPKDDMGYPIVGGSDVDPGEVVGGLDQDEDGIGQM